MPEPVMTHARKNTVSWESTVPARLFCFRSFTFFNMVYFNEKPLTFLCGIQFDERCDNEFRASFAEHDEGRPWIHFIFAIKWATP